MLRLSVRNLVLVFAVAASLSEAQGASPVGEEFVVSSDGWNSSVAGLKDGGFVVTFEENDDIYGRRYTASGSPVGDEFRVNTYELGDQFGASVAGLKDGGFVVTWRSLDRKVSNHDGIYGQQYDAKGERVGREFHIARPPPRKFSFVDDVTVAGLESGGFIFTWVRSSGDVYGRLYNAGGAPAGRQFRVNGMAKMTQDESSVAGLANGGFVVTWSIHSHEIWGQRYTAGGEPVGNAFHVNSSAVQYLRGETSVAGLKDGGFVVTWSSFLQDGGGDGVYGQPYTASGRPVGNEFRVNTYTASSQHDGSVTGLSDGGFVVTWRSERQDGADSGVYAQQYAPTGERVGGEFRVNNDGKGSQGQASIAGLESGGFVVTWLHGGNESSIRGRLYDAE